MAEVKDKVVSLEILNDAYSQLSQRIIDHSESSENPHGVSLTQLGITASAAELNYMDGVTSNVQTQLDTISDKITPIDKGGTGSSDGATGLANLFAAGSTVISSNQYGTLLPSTASEGTLFFKKSSGTVSDIDAGLLSELFLTIYPIGSIYISATSTSPASLFGGTWKQITDRVIVGAGGSYAVDSTGGEATVTLTVSQIPSHTHAIDTTNGGTGSSSPSQILRGYYGDGILQGATQANGGGAAHNNMQPYVAKYIWERTK